MKYDVARLPRFGAAMPDLAVRLHSKRAPFQNLRMRLWIFAFLFDNLSHPR